jgi:hypothetical protein
MNITELHLLSIEVAKKLMTQDIGAGEAFSKLFFAIDVLYHNQEAAKGSPNTSKCLDGKVTDDTLPHFLPRKSLNIWDEFSEHLSGNHKRLLYIIDRHTDIIKKLWKRVDLLEKQRR